MRSIKSQGGLTRGRGFGEDQRNTWLLGMPECASIHLAMQDLIGAEHQTSLQHHETGDAGVERDRSDIWAIVHFLHGRSPFSEDPSLRNIANGMVAAEIVNVDKAKEIGRVILEKMHGKSAKDFVFRRSDQAVTLSSKVSKSKETASAAEMHPQLLFQRYLLASRHNDIEIRNVLQYELCSFPMPLFDGSNSLRKASKHVLATALKKVAASDACPECVVTHVLDGGSLLHRLTWVKNSTFHEIASQYAKHVAKFNGQGSHVVFDGYEDGPSTKDNMHAKRINGRPLVSEVKFTPLMQCSLQREDFLSNPKNKSKFIQLVSSLL